MLYQCDLNFLVCHKNKRQIGKPASTTLPSSVTMNYVHNQYTANIVLAIFTSRTGKEASQTSLETKNKNQGSIKTPSSYAIRPKRLRHIQVEC